jgi:hypothetical protein
MKKEELQTSNFERCRLGRHHPKYNEIKHLDDIKVGRMFRTNPCGKPSVIFTPLTNEWGLHHRGSMLIGAVEGRADSILK